MNALVTTQDLTVRFPVAGGRRDTILALDRVSIDVRENETLGIIGESGSGKSTLGRVMVGLQPPTSGSILHGTINPFTLGAAAHRRHRVDYQMIFQDPASALNPRRAVLRSVREPLQIQGVLSRAEQQRIALDSLLRVGLPEVYAQRLPHQLSGGQKQRVNIARALTLRPKLLVCDEAIAALDVSIQAGILNLLMDIQEEFGISYLFITHNISVARHLSHRIAVMYLGQIVESGPADAVCARPLHPYTKALTESEPDLDGDGSRKRIVLAGEIPSPLNPPSGCRFRTRCPFTRERCATEEPAARELQPGRRVACHFAEELAELTALSRAPEGVRTS